MTTMKHTITLLAAAASLACLPCARADDGATPPAAPSAPGGDILRGPAVPDSALRPERGNRPINVTDGSGKFSLPMLEQSVLFVAIDEVRLRGETLVRVNELRSQFVAAVAAWEKDAADQRKALFDKRKNTASGTPPSDEFKKGMDELEAKRPKVAELRAKIDATLTTEERAQLKTNYDAAMKRARDAMTRQAEAERKKKAEQKRADDAKAEPEKAEPAMKPDAPK